MRCFYPSFHIPNNTPPDIIVHTNHPMTRLIFRHRLSASVSSSFCITRDDFVNCTFILPKIY